MIRLSTKEKARITEVFSSLQGEGTRLGERQIFVRFGGCNLHCSYCDEPETIPVPSGRVRDGRWVKDSIERLVARRPHRSVSWTGGEPLLHAEFLLALMPWTRERGLGNYLETNGTRPAEMRRLAPLCDVVAMDVKFPSATGKETWRRHEEFMRAAPTGRTFVKTILTSATTWEEWQTLLKLMSGPGGGVPLVLQPATLFNGVMPMEPMRVLIFLKEARRRLKNEVHLTPQWHPLWDLR